MLEILCRIESIYLLFYTQLKTLKTYLNKNLKKNFIWEMKILIEFFILFILTKNEQLKLYIDYWKLNILYLILGNFRINSLKQNNLRNWIFENFTIL